METSHEHDAAPWYVDFVLPVLLAEARKSYGREIRSNLTAAGFTDMPRNGARVVGGIARSGRPMGDVVAELGVSKQAASQLVDTLVLRGYLLRVPDPEDRRRMNLDLTDRGRDAAEEVRAAVDGVDAALLAAVGPEAVLSLRRALAVLAELPALGAG
ncbi:MAG TPA: MarR family transcriptional regulator [Acidimicrobiales bacterium]|jgi:DNA-binding MarR family transcriptional regulator